MTLHSTTNPASIFEGGKLNPGIYKIQNIKSETFLDIEVHSREVCCRPAGDLAEGRGFWEIKTLGGGYTVRFVEPEKPPQFCIPKLGFRESQLSVGVCPVTWRIEVIDNVKHHGFEYVSFLWGTMDFVWNLEYGSKENGTAVFVAPVANDYQSKRVWKLIPVKVEGTVLPSQLLSEVFGSGHPSCSRGTAGEPSAQIRVVESERDDSGTLVTEVTTVTTTTRRTYRVEDT